MNTNKYAEVDARFDDIDFELGTTMDGDNISINYPLLKSFLHQELDRREGEYYKKGFIDGFEHSGEGFNGEYYSSHLPKGFLQKDAEEALSFLTKE